MNISSIDVSLLSLILLNFAKASRPSNKRNENISRNKLPHHLSSHGKVWMYQWFEDTEDADEERTEHSYGDNNMQSDGGQTVTDVEDSKTQKHLCCTLGRASSLKSCSARPFIKLAKESLKVHQEEKQLGFKSDITTQYTCILKHRNSFIKCCQTAKIDKHHRNKRS